MVQPANYLNQELITIISYSSSGCIKHHFNNPGNLFLVHTPVSADYEQQPKYNH